MAPIGASFFSDDQSPFVDYVLSLIEIVSGIRLTPVDRASATSVDVYYGNDTNRPCGLRIPRVDGYTVDTVPPLPDARGGEHAVGLFSFDVFSAVRFWVADEAHRSAPGDAFDEHGRLRPDRSAQDALGVREVPIVNAYLLSLRSTLAETVGVPVATHLPPGVRCAVVLSHDVDSPIDPGSPAHALSLALTNLRRGAKVRASMAYGCGAAWYAALSRIQDPSARHFLFEEVMDAEERHGFRSTFFFAATSRFSGGGSRRDVAYDVAREPLRAVLSRLVDRGHGVGLHTGYLAGADADRIARERHRLEVAAGAPVTGSRHHYYHMTKPFWPSLAAHGRAGLRYDSSVSFNDAPGYRLGVALPFRPWNPETGQAVSTIQIPTLLMDSMLMSRPDQTVDGVLERVAGLISGLKRFEGVAAFDWHEYTSFPGSKRTRPWGEAYLAILDLLAGDREISVRTYDEVVAEQPA